MAYNIIGTVGNDTMDQSGDGGPGTIAGLAGSDCIFAGSASSASPATPGSDTLLIQNGNTGTVSGGAENDSISGTTGLMGLTSSGPMQLFGGDGADTIRAFGTASLTIVGGDDSNDGSDLIYGGNGDDVTFGNGGNDTILDDAGNNTVVLGFGNDSFHAADGSMLLFANQGNDLIDLRGAGTDTAFAGSGDDSIRAFNAGMLFGNEGADALYGFGPGYTIVGGNDSADGNDVLSAYDGLSILFGNGGDDTLRLGGGLNTAIGGAGNDSINGDGLFFANEGDDTIVGLSPVTVFGGLGNDYAAGGIGADTIQGNEGGDTIYGWKGIDTISGGSGGDVFVYRGGTEDGDNAAGGGPVDRITDVDFAADRFDAIGVSFAANVGAVAGGTLVASADNAIAAAFALAGGGAAVVAAQFTFSGRTYLAIDQGSLGTFVDADDLLIDITGTTGTITTATFI